jgi:DNA-binding IclR family transcriptional regulator
MPGKSNSPTKAGGSNSGPGSTSDRSRTIVALAAKDDSSVSGVRYAAPAAACAAEVLRLLKTSDGPLTLAQLERGLKRSKSLIFRVLRELELQDFVRRDETGRYRLAIQAFEVGAAYLRQTPVWEMVGGLLQEIAAGTGDSVNIGVLAGTDVLYLMHHQGASTYVTISRVGGRVPATCVAIGKALLAERPDDEIEKLFTDGLSQMTPKSVGTTRALMNEIDAVRRLGYALEHEQAVLGRSALAMTVRLSGLPDERVGLSISTDTQTFDRRQRDLLDRLRHAREVIERDAAVRDELTIAGATDGHGLAQIAGA